MDDDRTGSAASDSNEPSAENDAAQRQATLRALAQRQIQQPISADTSAQSPSPSAQPAQATRRPSALAARISTQRPSARRRAITIVVGLLVVAALVAGVVARVIGAERAATPPAHKLTMQINPTLAGLNCVSLVAWSPDSKLIAALGDSAGCGGSTPTAPTGEVFIYEAGSGKLMEQLHPDASVYNAPAMAKAIANATPNAPPNLLYDSLTWTPDSQALLLTFNVIAPSPQAQQTFEVFGLLRLGVSHPGLTAVWPEPTGVFPNNSLIRWDLTSGATAVLPAPAAATAYRWNSDGTLASAGSAAGLPTETTDGGATFTIWQPGSLQFGISQQNPQSQPGPPIAVAQDVIWASNFIVVSPDARYCYIGVPSFGSLVPPSTQRTFPQEPSFEPHDKALLALAQQMSLTPNPSYSLQTLVAWRPDGRFLAEIRATTTQSTAAPSALTVSVFDTATGKLVKRLTPTFTGLQTSASGQESLAWSPDGSHLLLADNVHGAITIWGPGALPK